MVLPKQTLFEDDKKLVIVGVRIGELLVHYTDRALLIHGTLDFTIHFSIIFELSALGGEWRDITRHQITFIFMKIVLSLSFWRARFIFEITLGR